MTDEEDVMEGPTMQQIVAEVVNAEDLKNVQSGLVDIAAMIGTYYHALRGQGIPSKLVCELVLQWSEITLTNVTVDEESV